MVMPLLSDYTIYSVQVVGEIANRNQFKTVSRTREVQVSDEPGKKIQDQCVKVDVTHRRVLQDCQDCFPIKCFHAKLLCIV